MLTGPISSRALLILRSYRRSTMTRVIGICLLLAAAGMAAAAEEPSKSAIVKKLAQELGDATIKGDFAKLIDHTYDTVVKELGGRDEAIKATQSIMKGLAAQGVTITVF